MARRRDKTVWFMVFLLLFVLASFGFLRSPFFNLQKITVQGNKLVKQEELVALANVGLGTNIFRISTSAVSKNVLLHPLVKGAEISRKLPGTLVIQVEERKPTAMIPVQNGFAVVDAQGVFLQRLDTWPSEPLPIISTSKLPDNLNLGHKIANSDLLAGLEIINEMPQDIYPLVGEFNARNRDNIVMYTRDGLEIKLGTADEAEQKFKIMKKFLLDKSYKAYRVGYYVDLTSGKPVLGKR